MEKEYAERLAKVEQRAGSNTHRLNDIDDLVKSIHSLSLSVEIIATEVKILTQKVNKVEEAMDDRATLSTSVQVLATEVKALTEKINKVEEDVEAIKDKPNKLLDGLTDKTLGCIVGALVAAAMALILK